MAKFGHELYVSYVSSINQWSESIKFFLKEIKRLELNKELFGNFGDFGDSDDEKEKESHLVLLKRIVGGYEHQLSEPYREKLYDKLSRFARKIEGLKTIVGE